MTTVLLPHSVPMRRAEDMPKSIIQKEQCCYLCGTTLLLEQHHIFGGSNRKLSEKFGLKVYLCANCHRGSAGVHFNKKLMNMLHKIGQRAFELAHSREEFIELFGKNYL